MIRIDYQSLVKLAQKVKEIQALNFADDVNADFGSRIGRAKKLALEYAKENAAGRILQRRSGRLYDGIKVEDDGPWGFRVVSTATNNGVSYGYVLEHGAKIYPKRAKCLVFRVPQGSSTSTAYGGSADKLVFAKSVTIPAFKWMEDATRRAMADAMSEAEDYPVNIDLKKLLGGEDG